MLVFRMKKRKFTQHHFHIFFMGQWWGKFSIIVENSFIFFHIFLRTKQKKKVWEKYMFLTLCFLFLTFQTNLNWNNRKQKSKCHFIPLRNL